MISPLSLLSYEERFIGQQYNKNKLDKAVVVGGTNH